MSRKYRINRVRALRLFISVIFIAGLLGCGTQENASKETVEATNTLKQNKQSVADPINESSDFKVTLLGTGSPILSMERFGNALGTQP